jgi:hydrogenase-4 membrane subunit HyfE
MTLTLVILVVGAVLLMNGRTVGVLVAYVVLAMTLSAFDLTAALASPATFALFALATVLKVVLAPLGILLFVRVNPAAADLRPSLPMAARLLLVIAFALLAEAATQLPALASVVAHADLAAFVILCGVGMLMIFRNLLAQMIGLLVLGIGIGFAGSMLAPGLPESIELGATFDALVATFIGLALVRAMVVHDPLLDVETLRRLRG